MGWLFDLAQKQGKTKKGKLAEELYSSSSWEGPKYREIRSLENILRKLDKGDLSNLEKWADWFPRLLAAVLDVSEEVIWEEAALVREASERPSGMYWLADLRGAKPLDLARENPFPGLPPEVLTPDKWEAHWWHTRPAEEAEVVATFLQARRLARVVRAETWSDALERLPNRGAVLVILTDEEEAQSANVEDVPARLSLLVAAYGEAPVHEGSEGLSIGTRGHRRSDWKAWGELENPHSGEWIEPLLRWVHGRLEPGGHFDFDLALQLTQRAPLRGMFIGPCDLLSFCGLLDETRRSVAERLDVMAMLRVWLRLSTMRAKGMDPQLVEFFEDPARGAALVYGLFRNYLLEFGAYGGLPTAQDWASFVPAGLFPPPDYEGARALVSEPGDALHGDKLRRLRDKLGPSHIALIDTLTGLRILRPRKRDSFLSHQFWLEELIVSDAIEALPEASPQDLGKALLRNPAYEVVPVLWGRFKNGDVTALERSLEALDPSNVFTVAAFEACFRAYGLAVLSGLEIDKALASCSLDAQTTLCFPRYNNSPPTPRLDLEKSHGRSWTGQGAWYLAVMALAERLDKPTVPHPALDPWHNTDPPDGLHQILASIDRAAWERDPPAPWALQAYDLGRRLWEQGARGHLYGSEQHGLATLLVPIAIVEAVEKGEPTPVDISWFAHQRRPRWAVLHDQAERKRVERQAVLQALWQAWKEAPDPKPQLPYPRPGSAPGPELAEAWRAAPAELFAGPLFMPALKANWFPRATLTREQWLAWLGAYNDERYRIDLRLDEIPDEIIMEGVRRGTFGGSRNTEHWKELWERIPALLARETLVGLDEGTFETRRTLLWSIPESAWSAMLEDVAEWSLQAGRSPEDRLTVARAMHDYVGRRQQNWERAYEVLVKLIALETEEGATDDDA